MLYLPADIGMYVGDLVCCITGGGGGEQRWEKLHTAINGRDEMSKFYESKLIGTRYYLCHTLTFGKVHF